MVLPYRLNYGKFSRQNLSINWVKSELQISDIHIHIYFDLGSRIKLFIHESNFR